ncbi:Peroxisomal acyl-coenzyme A oxidase 3 [Nymphon striatum]|nr:Peroxisomal acyl-coenzyme A oxidase 3 [Nymphon striatum]
MDESTRIEKNNPVLGEIEVSKDQNERDGSAGAPTEAELISDFPPGPLDCYRKKASFCWKQMKLFLFGEEVIKVQNRVWKTLENDPLFYRSPGQIPSLDDDRRLTSLQYKRVQEYIFLSEAEFFSDPAKSYWVYLSIGMYDWALAIKKALGTDYMISVIQSNGTKCHRKYVKDMLEMKIIGCLCMTELSHGTNTKKMRTTATFDKKTQMFVINTPDFEATKVWVGNLGKTATHAVLFAQLHTPDGSKHGLHSFIVPIRDPSTLLPFPGVMAGDLGPKLGLNGLDNGFIAFHNYAIPKECLLNRTGDVSHDGRYVTSFKDPNKRFGISLGALSLGRIGIVGMSVANLFKALVIAVRYSATRRQFGPSEDEEIPILEYQMQQWRLIPYVAASFSILNFMCIMRDEYIRFQVGLLMGDKSEEQIDLGAELHSLSSASKPLASWTARDAIQECREACGGHGYLQVSGLGSLRNDNDANCTYEGDNNVLLQQTSNYLLAFYALKMQGKKVSSPIGSVNFINDMDEVLSKKNRSFSGFDNENYKATADLILDAFQFLTSHLLFVSSLKYKKKIDSGKDQFSARNDSQVYYLRSLALAYIEFVVLKKCHEFIFESSVDSAHSDVLQKLFCLHGLWSLEKHMSTLYQAGYCQGPVLAEFIKEGILNLCSNLKNEVVALVDVIAPPDFILNSAIGSSNGQLYKNLYAAILQTPNALERPHWWKEFIQKIKVASIKPKL